MHSVKSIRFLLLMLLIVVLSGCSLLPQAASEPVVEPALQASPAPTETVSIIETAAPTVPQPGSPGDVVVRFLSEYVSFAEVNRPTIGNPEFAAQALLSDDYVKQYREILAGFDGGGFDPVLNAQMVPPGPVEAGDVVIEGDRAWAGALFGRGVLPEPYQLKFFLKNTNGEWKIVPGGEQPGPATPEATVEAFYRWYLDYIGTGENFRNPMVDRAYRAAPYLTPYMVYRADQAAEAGGFDPFLCAQDVPTSFRAAASFYNGGRPVVLVESDFPGHTLTADMIRVNFDQWAITNISCGRSPAGTVKAFYTWMLGYSTRDGEWHNPWSEGSYRESPFLSPGWIQRLDEKISSGESLMADPALLAQDLPASFIVSTCPNGEPCAMASFRYGEATIRQLRVETIEVDGRLRVESIQAVDRPESPAPAESLPGVDAWLPMVDEQYGFAIQYPAGWEMDLSNFAAHTPAENLVMRTMVLTPPQLAGQLAAIILEVCEADETTVLNYRGTLEKVEEITANGFSGTLYRSDPGILTYVFRHPSKENTWITLTDNISQFPGREQDADQVADVLQAMLTTIDFSK